MKGVTGAGQLTPARGQGGPRCGGFHQGQGGSLGRWAVKRLHLGAMSFTYVKDIAPFSGTGVAVATGWILLPFFP